MRPPSTGTPPVAGKLWHAIAPPRSRPGAAAAQRCYASRAVINNTVTPGLVAASKSRLPKDAAATDDCGVTPEDFIAKWRGNTRSERAAAQQHFLDLCDLLGVETPGRPGYDFEQYTRKVGDKPGYADVWRDRCFVWEYKGDAKNLVQAYAQLKQYVLSRLLALNLERAAAGR
jgi:hypothetical protein